MFISNRYKLLLEDLLEHTPMDHHDYSQLQGKVLNSNGTEIVPSNAWRGTLNSRLKREIYGWFLVCFFTVFGGGGGVIIAFLAFCKHGVHIFY